MTDEQKKPDDEGFRASGWWGTIRLSAESVRLLLGHAGPAVPWFFIALSAAVLILSIFLGWSWVK